jgi:predicted metal-dependent phosphoesterase TrpH
MEIRIDLHAHTTASDGDLSPTELVNHALEKGLGALGLTDHDTIAGVPEAMRAAKKSGLPLAWGVEVSAEFSPGTMHILGYFVDITNAPLLEALRNLQGGRDVRNEYIIGKLNELGINISIDEVLAVAGEESVGRPHIAQVILSKGYCQTRQEVFDKYLAKGAAAYFDRIRYSPQQSIALIRNAGGVPVLAHPGQLKLEDDALEALVGELVGYGLKGIETLYWNHTPEHTAFYTRLARKYDLVTTGGSDFHGPNRPETRLGDGGGDLNVPFSFYENLLKAAGRSF